MNYILQLQQEVKEHKQEIQNTFETLDGLRKYLLSDKFRCGDSLDGYVNIRDVLHRLPK